MAMAPRRPRPARRRTTPRTTKLSGAALALSAMAVSASDVPPGYHVHTYRVHPSLRLRSLQDETIVDVVAVDGATESDASPPPDAIVAVTVPDYEADKCDEWLSLAFDEDSDGSGGLSESEFHAFLMDVTDEGVDQYLDQFQDHDALPWMFKVVHKALACRCRDLGGDPGCCLGENAEVPFGLLRNADLDLSPEMQAKRDEFRADLCNSVAAVFQDAVPAPPPTTPSPTTPSPTTSAPVAAAVETTVAATAAATLAPVATAVETTVAATEAAVAATDATEPAGTDATEPAGTEATVPATDAATEPAATEPAVAVTDATEPAAEATEPAVEPEAMVINIVGSMLDYGSFDYATLLDGDDANNENVPPYLTAADIQGNADDNGVLQEVILAFGQLSNEVLGDISGGGNATEAGKRNLRGAVESAVKKRRTQAGTGLGTLKPVQVTDIPCPEGLPFAPPNAPCVNFMFNIVPNGDGEANGGAPTFQTMIEKAINEDGRLYDIVVENAKVKETETAIKGLGSPGKGVEYKVAEPAPATPVEPPAPEAPAPAPEGGDASASAIVSAPAAAPEEDDGGGGIGPGLIVLIILAVILVPMASIAMYARYKKVKDAEKREELQALRAKRDLEAGLSPEEEEPYAPPPPAAPASDDEGSVYSDKAKDEYVDTAPAQKVSAGSALAAMGAAGAAAALAPEMIGKEDKAATEKEIRTLAKETNAPKSADELLAAYKGREGELLSHLRKMKERQDAKKGSDGVRAKVEALVKEVGSPKTADELLATYEGREDELVKNLEKMKEKKDAYKKGGMAAAAAVSEPTAAAAPEPNGEAAAVGGAAAAGAAVATGAAVAAVAATRSGSASDEQKKEVESLVASTKTPKSSEELLAAYEGREDELIKNLEKMKSKQDRASVRALVDETNPGKSAEELLAAYEGREDELIKNLEKMKSKEGKSSLKKSESQRESIRQLVDETNPGKSAEELLAAYEGREDDLIKNLEKMKAKQDKKKLEKSESLKASVRQLVDETNPGKSSEELLAAYEGREDELIKNLEKMKSKEEKSVKRDSIRQLVDETNPGKSAEELLAAYGGREDELIKNLEKMKAKQDKRSLKQSESQRESIRQLVDETNPGKGAEELLAAYEGREDELIKNLEKMKAKQDKKKLDKSEGLKASVRQLVDETNPGKSSEELLAAYEGREDELIKNLDKMKSKQQKSSTRDSVRKLVEETNPGKSSEELLAAYEGREEELIKNLEKVKTKQNKESIRNLVDSTNPGKSAEELMAAYEGSEEELIQNLEKMKTKQTKAEIKSLVSSTTPGKSSKELLEAYEGREEELLRNLQKMKAKQDKQAGKNDDVRSRVADLVKTTNPGKSTEELLDAYQGREEELINHLQKLNSKKP